MRVHPHPAVSASLLFAACQLFSSHSWAASIIVRDGSLGSGPTAALTSSGTITRNAVTYNKIAIPEAYGQRAGANVFHSFSTFNVGTGDGAVFSISAPAANVISRVTGGSASAINGLISLDPGVTGSAPNFFFINPAGVTFGAGAAIDVPAAFHVSTADYIKFPDGNFYANPATASTLSIQNPAAFGFLGGTPGNLTLSSGAVLVTQTGAVSMVGGNVSIDNASITTQGGDVRIVALGSRAMTKEVALTGTITDAQGSLELTNGASVAANTVGTTPGGNIAVSAGDVLLDSSSIGTQSTTGSSAQIGNLDLVSSGAVILQNGGSLSSYTISASHAGQVTVNAASLLIDGSSSSIVDEAQGGTGAAGDVSVTTTGNLTIRNSAWIDGNTYTAGHGGQVSIHVGGDLSLESNGYIGASALGAGDAGGVDISVAHDMSMRSGYIDSSTFYGIGNAGQISISVRGDLSMLGYTYWGDSSQINSASYTSGNGGAINISAANIRMEGPDTGIINGTYAYAPYFSGPATGNAGDVSITTPGTLTLLTGGRIDTGTGTLGRGGVIRINAGNIFADARGIYSEPAFTGITNSVRSSGLAGAVYVTATEDITLLNFAQIGSSAWGTANAAPSTVSARNITLNGNMALIGSAVMPTATGNGAPVTIYARGNLTVSNDASIPAGTFGAGNASNINLNVAGELKVLSGGDITAGTYGAGSAGLVIVNAGSIRVDGSGVGGNASFIGAKARAGSSGQAGNVSVTARDSITLSNGGQLSIQNDATVANPASINRSALYVNAPTITLKDAQITAASTGNIAASNIAIHFTDLLNIDPSSITTSANLGNGGAISIAGAGTMILDRSQITTSVAGLTGNGGDISIQANTLVMNSGFIQANTAAASAMGGSITIDVNAIIPSGNMLFLGGTTPYSFQPDVFGFNVIQAAAPTGLSGAVQVTSPILDISGTLTVLNAKTIGTAGLARSPCQSTGGSSLVQTGRGGFTPLARDLLGPGGSATGPLAGNSATPGARPLLLSAAMHPSTLIGKCA